MKSPLRGRDTGANDVDASSAAAGNARARRTLEALREVLAAAQARGVALTASFQHFDRSANGVVGVDDLMAALVDLRLSSPATVWDEHDAEDCLELLTRGKSRAYCSRDDFVRFFAAPADVGGASVSTTTQRSKVTRKPTGSPPRDRFEELADTDGVGLRIATGAEQKAAPKGRKKLQVTLPEWAHARSKRALTELESMQRHRGLKRGKQFQLSSLAASSPGSFESSVGEEDENNNANARSPGEDDESAEAGVARLPLKSISPHRGDEGSRVLEFKPFTADKVFAVDDDHAIAYRILTYDIDKAGDFELDEETARLRAVLLQVLAPKANRQGGGNVSDEPQPTLAPFRLTVFVDVFQHLETLAAFFEPLLVHFPRGKILLCGHPVRSKRSTVWNSSFVANAYGKLLEFLTSQSREWLIQPKTGIGAVPQYLVGFGTGASTALQLVGMSVPMSAATTPSLQSFAHALRALVLVNSAVNVDTAVRGSLQAMRVLLQRPSSDAMPLHEACLSLLFSEHYVTQVAPSRRAAMETFFRTRRDFFVGGNDSSGGCSNNTELLRLLIRGVLKNSDVRGAVANLAALPRPFAVLIVHGSQNALFLPDQVESLVQTLSSQPNSMAESVAAALATSGDNGKGNPIGSVPFHVSWLKSGHEIVQERAAFLYDLLRQMIAVDPRTDEPASSGSTVSAIAAGVVPVAAASAPVATDASPIMSAVVSLTDLSSGHDGHNSNAEPSGGQQHALPSTMERVRDLLKHHGLKWIQQELYDRGIEGSGATDAILKRYEQVLEENEANERRRLAEMARQQARLREIKRLRLEKQRAEIERKTRDQETELSISRKETERQRHFFAQMEAQKLAQARMHEEQQCMALEDALALKYENHLFLEDERRVRNDSMAKKVEEIEAERGEVDRSNYQVQLQQERLAAQLARREALKLFQKAFEQNELVSSAVEAYCLDASPVYEQFAAIAEGSRLVANDLAHFYELKELQKEESILRRSQLDKLREQLVAKQAAQRNLERVLAKAKSTGMIAKAGLGTVRIVPITPSEMAALARELDELRDECERMQHDAGLRSQELQWKDQLLQRLSVLIKRNEGFREEMARKLGVCLEKGNDQVLLLREDDEQMMERLAANRKLRERLETRATAVSAERIRAEQATTEYFDTRLRVEGSSQRVLRLLMVRELTQEAAQLEARVAELESEEPRIKRDLSANCAVLNESAARTFDIQCALEKLAQVTHSAPGRPSDGRKSIVSLENPIDASMDGSDDDSVHISERVRRKRHVDRSAEERRWVAMDFALHFARYYKTMSAEEVELIAKNTDSAYTCALAKEQLERLMTLPARNCLALAFLKTADELEAHALLRKFSFGDGELHFAQLDKHFVMSSKPAKRPVASTLETLASALEKETVNRLTGGRRTRKEPKQVGAVPTDQSVLLDEGASSSVTTLFSAANVSLDPHKSVTHTFRVPAHSVGVLALTVSIVFQGSFKPAGYQNGRLAAMLYALPPSTSSDSPSVRAPMPIGKCFSSHDIALCTPHSLGRLVVRHEPEIVPLCGSATYQVVVGAPVLTRYSIDVTARTALFAGEALQRKRSDALKKQELLPLRRDEIQNVFTTIQLSERKKRLASLMATEAKDAGRAAELELLRATRELERDNAAPQLSNEQRLALHRRTHDAEARFTESSFRYAKREEEVRDINQCLRELTRIHVDLLDECEQMEKDLADYRTCLPRIAAALAAGENGDDTGDVAGARMAKALNVEYEPIGARSAKLRWAELSAMKTKLPSMMTPAERLRRKYKKGRDALEKKEREWILLDRILHPRVYDWEERLSAAATGSGAAAADVAANYWRMRLHGTHPTLSKDEQQLAVLSKLEVERIMKSPWNLLERKEIQVRKVVTRFRDDYGASSNASASISSSPPTTMVALLRAAKWSELTTEEREWRQYDRVLNPAYYRAAAKSESAARFQQLAQTLKAAAGASTAPADDTMPPSDDLPPPLPVNVAREDLVAALNTPEDEVFTLQSDLLRARTLLLKYDPQLSSNILEAARVHLGQQTPAEIAETDVDARCRLVYDELQRAIANTRNEYMDSSVLHSTLQRFPTKVLRLELEKDLDRLLRSQIAEREEFELRALFLDKKNGSKRRPAGGQAGRPRRDGDDSESVSELDSDEEAVVAREARDARRQAKLGTKNANARGKALKQQSIQRQRRRIRDALQPRSLEERRRLLEEQELGFGGCMACRTNPCSWKTYLADTTATIQSRMEVLQEELERVKHCSDATMSSGVCLAAVQSGRGAIVMRRVDLFDELTDERKRWEAHLRLQRVDAEFHATFQCRAPYFETRALHAFPQVQLTDKIQRALQREHNALVAQLAASEMVEDALEAMLEGWVFGERESQRAAGGYVPSLKRDGPLSMQDLRRLEQEAQKPQQDEAADAAERREEQGTPREKWVPIEVAALERQRGRKVVQQGSALDKSLTETENALRFGIFCMTLMYFRGLAMLKRQRATWSLSKTSGSKFSSSDVSAEKRRMLLEQQNVAKRQHKAAAFDAKAQRAAARSQKLHEEKAAAYRRRLVAEHKRATRETRAAIEIQRTYRGHMGRLAGKRWMVRRREIDAQRALDCAAAVTLQRAYRGRLGRLAAEERRIELAEFISQLRAEEAIEEEEAYWRAHPIERTARRVAAFVKKQA